MSCFDELDAIEAEVPALAKIKAEIKAINKRMARRDAANKADRKKRNQAYQRLDRERLRLLIGQEDGVRLRNPAPGVSSVGTLTEVRRTRTTVVLATPDGAREEWDIPIENLAPVGDPRYTEIGIGACQ